MANNINDNMIPEGLSSFFGGQSVDNKLGSAGQFYDDEHLDFRTNPSNFSVLPGFRETSGGVVTDLVTAMDQVTSGIRYAAGDGGGVYRISTAGVWSSLGNLGENGGAGAAYRADVDHFYVAGQTKVGRIQRVSSVAGFQPNWFQNGVSSSATCYKTGGSNTYVPTIAIIENNANKRPFTVDIEPGYKIGVKVLSRGTGNWTLTLHDDANNSLASVTITNANLSNNAINYFVFSSPITLQRGDAGAGSALTYHFHLTSTVADGTVATTTATSMIDCDMEYWANALVTTQNGLHPMANFLGFTLIGNGHYLAVYEPLQDNPTATDFERHRLTFPPGFEVCGIAQKNLMAIIACEKRSTTGEVQEGALFFWNGTSDTYNDWWPVPEGSPDSMFAEKNTAYYIAGGDLYRIQGSDQPVKVRHFRNVSGNYSGTTAITHAYPNMMTVHQGLLHIGYPGTTTNVSLKYGVYTYGVISREYPLSWGYGYTISSGSKLLTNTNNLKLGLVRSYGDTLYTTWRDDSVSPHKYGVDVKDNTSSPASTFSLTGLVFDDGRAWAYKHAAYMICTFDPAPANTTLTLKYKIDNDSDYTYSDTPVATGDQWVVMPIERDFLILTYGLDGTSGTTSINVSSLNVWIDPKQQERPVGG